MKRALGRGGAYLSLPAVITARGWHVSGNKLDTDLHIVTYVSREGPLLLPSIRVELL